MTTIQKSDKSAIIISPFYEVDSLLDKHFQKVYREAIFPVLKKLNYNSEIIYNLIENTSNLEIRKKITRDDLVIAHLTNLNPNIYDSLKFRNKLPNKLIVLLMDEIVEPDPRFEIERYPFIRYKGDNLIGLNSLKLDLESLIKKIENKTDEGEGIFIHLSEEVKYEEYEEPDTQKTLNEVIHQVINEDDPESLLQKAQIALSKNPVDMITIFTECVPYFLEPKGLIPTDDQYDRLDNIINHYKIQAESTGFKLLHKAQNLYPSSRLIENTLYFRYADSKNYSIKKYIIDKICERYSLDLKNGSNELKFETLTRHDFRLLYWMFYAFKEARVFHENANALILAKGLRDKFNQTSIFKSCYADMMEINAYPLNEIIEERQRAIFCADVDYLSIFRLASALSELNKFVDRIEVILLACMINIDRAENFSGLARTMSDIIVPTNKFIHKQLGRSIPKCITKENVMYSVWYCKSCPDYSDEKHGDECTLALQNIDVDLREMDDFYRGKFGGQISRSKRSNFVQNLYNSPKMKSPTTDENLFKKRKNDRKK